MLSNELQFSSYVCCIHTYTYIVEKTLGSPLDCKETKPVHPKGNQPWMLLGRTDAEVEAPILWPLDAKNWLTGEDPDAGKNWRQEEKGRGWQRMRWLDDITDSMGMGLSRLLELVMISKAWHATVHGITMSQIQLGYWTELNIQKLIILGSLHYLLYKSILFSHLTSCYDLLHI